MRKYSENIMKIVFLTAACVSIIAVILICVFLFASGVPAIKEIGVSDFLLGDSWKPNQDLYRVSADDHRQCVCHGRCYPHRGSDRTALCGIHGALLPERGFTKC